MKIDQTRTLQLLDQRIIRLNRPCFHGCYPTVWDASPLVSSASLPSLRTVSRYSLPYLPEGMRSEKRSDEGSMTVGDEE